MKNIASHKAISKALIWEVIGTFGSSGTTFIISIFLARLLSPAEFGLVGMAMAFISIAAVAMEAGFNIALIQKKNVDNTLLSSVFWICLAVAIVLFTLLQVSAVTIASFYKIDEIERIIRLLSFIIVFKALATVQTALLNRNLHFRELNLRVIISSLISGVVGIVLALQGWGVYALITQALTNEVIITIALWYLSKWRPSFICSIKELKVLFGFSSFVLLDHIIGNTLNRISPMVIGKFFSPTTLGFYNRAESLNALVIRLSAGTLGKVFFPVLSQLQNEKEKFKRTFRKVLSLTSILSFFLSGVLILCSNALIIGLFGSKWIPSVAIFNILMYKVFNYPVNALIVKAFLASGKSKENFFHGIIRKVLVLITLVTAVSGNFDYFLYSIVITSFIGTIYNCLIVAKLLNMKFKTLITEAFDLLPVFLIGVLFVPLITLTVKNIYIEAFCNMLLYSSFFAAYLILFKKNYRDMLQNRFKILG